jgi:uncharacterized membrane protein
MAIAKGRLEACSDGVLAIVITILVLELKVPQGSGIEALKPWIPPGLSCVLSIIDIGIDWNKSPPHAAGGQAWGRPWAVAHLILVLRLSLFPFATGWKQLIDASVALIGVVPDLRIEPESNRTRICPEDSTRHASALDVRRCTGVPPVSWTPIRGSQR